MQKGIIELLGHKIECENETGDTIDGDRLSKTIKEGRKIGILYKPGTDNIIGTWNIVNEYEVAAKEMYYWIELHCQYTKSTDNSRPKDLLEKYKTLCKKEQ